MRVKVMQRMQHITVPHHLHVPNAVSSSQPSFMTALMHVNIRAHLLTCHCHACLLCWCVCVLFPAAVKVEKATCSAPGQKQVSGRKML
jgi:hypothetical protein